MWIKSFHIEQFGQISGQEAAPLQPGLNIFLGGNEAGKSTCLNFLRQMFFGFKARKNRPDYLGPGKKAGGSLALQSRDGRDFQLIRRVRRSKKEFTLLDPQGLPLAEGDWSAILRGCTEDVYDKVFALGLEDLISLYDVGDDKLRHALHGASFGLGLRSPAQALAGLEKSMADIYLPGATVKPLNRLAAELEDIRARMAGHGSDSDRHDALSAELANLLTTLAELENEKEKTAFGLAGLQARLAAWRTWEELLAARRDLAILPPQDGVFAPGALERLELALSRREDARAAMEARRDELERLQKALAALPDRSALLSCLPDLRGLGEQKESVRSTLAALPELEAEATALKRELDGLLALWGPDWDLARARAFDHSLFAREELERRIEALADAEAEISKIDERAARLRGLREEEKAALSSAREELAGLEALDGQNSAQSPASLEALHKRATSLLQVCEDLPGLKAEAVEADNDAAAAIASISPAWTRSAVQTFDLSLGARQRLCESGTRLLEAERRVEAAREGLDKALAAEREAELETRLLEAALAEDAGLPELPVLEERLGRIRSLSAALAALPAARRDYKRADALLVDDLTAQGGASSRLAYKIFGLAAGLAVLLLLTPQAEPSLAGSAPPLRILLTDILGAALGAYGLWRLFRPLAGPVLMRADPNLVAWRADLLAKMNGLEAEAGKLLEQMRPWSGLPPALDGEDPNPAEPARLDALANSLEAGIKSAVLRDQRRLELARAEEKLFRLSRLAEQAKSLLDEAAESGLKLRGLWRERLAALELPMDFAPSLAEALFDQVEASRRLIRVAEERRNKLKKNLDRLEEFFAEAGRVDILQPLARPVLEGREAFQSALPRMEELLGRWSAARLARQAAEQARRNLEEKTRRLASVEQELEGAAKAGQAALNEREALLAEWRDWLEARGLPAGFLPQTVRKAFEAMEKCLEKGALLERLHSRIQAAQDDLAVFCARLAATARESGLPEFAALSGQPEPREALEILDALSAHLDEAQKSLAASREKTARLAELEAALEDSRRALGLAEENLLEILSGGRARDADDYRLREAAASRRGALLEQEKRLLLTLKDLLCGPGREDGPALEALLAELERTSLDSLEREAAAFKERLAALAERDKELAAQSGEIKAAQSSLLRGAGAADLKQREQRILAEISALSREWSALAIARQALEISRKNFSQAHQHKVVREAGRLFSRITGGVYEKLINGPDDRLLVLSARGEARDPETELSRGAREQLYLALRLAYMAHHGEEGEPLPAALDDIMVNFDPARAAQCASALAEFAKGNQVLFFTCHDRTAGLLKKNAPQAGLFTVAGGRIIRD